MHKCRRHLVAAIRLNSLEANAGKTRLGKTIYEVTKIDNRFTENITKLKYLGDRKISKFYNKEMELIFTSWKACYYSVPNPKG
jgi:hypothetical protein